jgi:hypothetical protein
MTLYIGRRGSLLKPARGSVGQHPDSKEEIEIDATGSRARSAVTGNERGPRRKELNSISRQRSQSA